MPVVYLMDFGDINWPHLRKKLREDVEALPHFLRNPIETMRTLPAWEWPTILILQAAFAMTCSFLNHLLMRDFIGLVTGFVIAPIASFLLLGLTAGFFFYLFSLVFHRPVPYRQLYIQVLFASIPLSLLSIVAFYLPPLVLLGSAAGLLLLYVAMVDTLHAPPIPLRNVLIALMALHALYWGFQQVQNTAKHKTLLQKATPESLDILEKELNDGE